MSVLTRLLLLFAAVPGLTLFAADKAPWTAPTRAAETENPVAAGEKVLATAKKSYQAECASCHGDKGKGDGADGRELGRKPTDLTNAKVQEQTDGALFWKLTEGRKPMPAYRKMLTDDERWGMVRYMRELQKTGAETKAPKSK